MTVTLCDRFPAYTPTGIRRERAREIFLLVTRLNKHNRKKKRNTSKDGKRIIRRPASDNWF